MPATRTRLPDWEHRLSEYLTYCRRQSQAGTLGFSWNPAEPGGMHCVMFAAGAVEAMTGQNPYKELAGQEEYDNALGAYKVVRKLGHHSLDQLLRSLFAEIRLTRASFGDIVLVPGVSTVDGVNIVGMELACGVAEPPFFWCIQPEQGISRGNLLDAVKAYHV